MSKGWVARSTRSFALGLAVVALGGVVGVARLAALGPDPAVAGPTTPAGSWTRADPERLGLDPAGLRRLAEDLGGDGVVVRDGYLAHSWGNPSARADVASVSKVFYTALLAMAVEQGRLAGFDVPVADVEPCLAALGRTHGRELHRFTFRELAAQTSGYGTTDKPGAAFNYASVQSGLLAHVVLNRLHGPGGWADADARVLRPLLGDVLGFEDRPTLLAFGPDDRPGRLAISVRDLARFGLLYLNGGRWGERQLLSEASVRMMTGDPLPHGLPRTAAAPAEVCPEVASTGSAPRSEVENATDHFGAYSWMWWVNAERADGGRLWPDAPADTYLACGHRNCQRALVVVPSRRLVVAWNGTRLGERGAADAGFVDNAVLNAALHAVIDAVRDPAPLDPAT